MIACAAGRRPRRAVESGGAAVTLSEIDELHEREIARIERGKRSAAPAQFCPTLPDGTPDWWRLLLERNLRRLH
jgi:hypothetical protein